MGAILFPEVLDTVTCHGQASPPPLPPPTHTSTLGLEPRPPPFLPLCPCALRFLCLAGLPALRKPYSDGLPLRVKPFSRPHPSSHRPMVAGLSA